MGIFSSIRQWFVESAARERERKEFQKLVDDQTKPIRRSAYLKERLAQAVLEGKMIAAKEFEKKNPPKKTAEDFHLDKDIVGSKIDFHLEDPMKFVNKQGGKDGN